MHEGDGVARVACAHIKMPGEWVRNVVKQTTSTPGQTNRNSRVVWISAGFEIHDQWESEQSESNKCAVLLMDRPENEYIAPLLLYMIQRNVHIPDMI